MAKTHVGILELDRETTLPNLRSNKGGVGFEGTTPKYWNGTAWSAFSGAGGVTTWDELYDLDKSLTIDSTSLTFALTHATNNGLSLTGDAGSSGNVLDISNAGSGKDIDGTGSTWHATKAGVITGTGFVLGDDESVTLGASSDATITWDGTASLLDIAGAINFEDNVTLEANATITQAGLAGSDVYTITAGDMVMSDGSLSITDADNAATVVVVNNTVSNGGNVIDITADAVTDKSIVYIDNGGASLTTGYYINCNDDGVSDFTVGADGATAITTAAATTHALHVTGVQTSQDMVTFDNTSGVIASDKAVLLLDAGGAIAAGGNILRIAPTGTPNAGAIGIEYVGAGKTNQALYIDADPTGTDVVAINGGGALTDGNAVLALTNDGNLASGGNLLSVDIGGTPNAAAIAVEISGASKDLQALVIDVDAATDSMVELNSSGAIANDKAVLEVKADGTPASAGSNIFRVDGSGLTATNNPVLAEIVGAGVDVIGLYVDADGVDRDVVTFNGGGAISDGHAVLGLTNDGNLATGGSLLNVTMGGTPNAGAIAVEIKAQKDAQAFVVDSDAATNHAVEIIGSGAIAEDKAMLHVQNDGTPAAADSHLLLLDYTSATVTNNPIAMKINHTGTGAALEVTSDGANTDGLIVLESDNTGALGAVLTLSQDGDDQANDDVVGRIYFNGQDDANAAENYARIDAKVNDVTAANPDGSLEFYVDTAGTLTKKLALDSSIAGITVGTGAAAGIVESSGDYDLTLQTGNATTGTITITDGANGNVTVTPNGSGQVDLANVVLMSKTQSITGAGAIDVVSSITELDTTGGGAAYTLADGTEGQIKYIVMKTDAGDATLTPTSLAGASTTITFDAVGDAVTLLFTNSEWYVVGNNGAVLA